jgi:hypothetical protein
MATEYKGPMFVCFCTVMLITPSSQSDHPTLHLQCGTLSGVDDGADLDDYERIVCGVLVNGIEHTALLAGRGGLRKPCI